MKIATALVYIFGIISLATAHTTEGFRGTARPFTIRPKTAISMRGDSGEKFNTKRDTRATDGFPEELEYLITLEGDTETELHLVRDRAHVLPDGFQQDLAGRFYRKPGTNEQIVAFYRDLNGHGLFACRRQTSTQGEFECGISAMLNIREETCFISLGASHADCSAKDGGPPVYLSEPIDDVTLRNEAVRYKRNILPAEGFKIVEVAYLPDAKFTNLFYRRHPGDTATAETEIRIFCTLLTNEINVYYSTLKETSNGALDIQVYPTAVALPGFQQNFVWSENNNDGTNLCATDALKSNIEYIINDSDFISERFDFVFALTGFNLKDSDNGNSLVSLTYRRTICTNSRSKYALTEFTSWNLPRILAHELGHALGAEHDGGDNACPAGVNLMSFSLFPPTSNTKDTYQYFSTCSVAEITAHLNSQAPCLDDDSTTYEEFVESFCQGFLGEQESSVDKQCQRLTNHTGSTACDLVTEEACYSRNQISCSDSHGECTQKLQFLWNGTPCGTDKVCYKGSCVASFDICTTTTTSSTTSTSTTSTSTTSTPTTSTSTSTTSTTPTTTTTTTTPSTTTSTTSTTSTTTPTTTTSTTTPTTTTSTTSTTSTTTPTTTTSTTSTTSSTTSTATTPSTTSTTTTSTTSTTTTPTTTAPVPCSCCGFKRDKRRKRCCKKGKQKISAICYCCGPLKNVEEPDGWTGRRF